MWSRASRSICSDIPVAPDLHREAPLAEVVGVPAELPVPAAVVLAAAAVDPVRRDLPAQPAGEGDRAPVFLAQGRPLTLPDGLRLRVDLAVEGHFTVGILRVAVLVALNYTRLGRLDHANRPPLITFVGPPRHIPVGDLRFQIDRSHVTPPPARLRR